MELSVLERLMLQAVLPKEGNFTNLKLLRVAKENLSFSEEELKVLQVREVGEGADRKMMWNNGVSDKNIEFGDTVTDIIKKQLKRLDETNKLTIEHISLYEKFLGKE